MCTHFLYTSTFVECVFGKYHWIVVIWNPLGTTKNATESTLSRQMSRTLLTAFAPNLRLSRKFVAFPFGFEL